MCKFFIDYDLLYCVDDVMIVLLYLVDVMMFWVVESGGVKCYLCVKYDFLCFMYWWYMLVVLGMVDDVSNEIVVVLGVLLFLL